MVSITAEELLAFFGVEPTPRDPSEGWFDGDNAYEVKDGPISLTFSIAPAYPDVRLRLLFRDSVILDLHGTGVRNVRIFSAKGKDLLDIELSENVQVLVQIVPAITVTQIAK